MAKAPGWLAALIDDLTPSWGPALWVGPALQIATRAAVSKGTPEGPEWGQGHAAVFVAATGDEELVPLLRRLRPACAPGALLCLLLPESASGMGARMARAFDPLGRAGRKPRPLSELCGALLAVGATGVCVRRVEGQLRCVTARLPSRPLELDQVFDLGTQATL